VKGSETGHYKRFDYHCRPAVPLGLETSVPLKNTSFQEGNIRAEVEKPGKLDSGSCDVVLEIIGDSSASITPVPPGTGIVKDRV